MSAKPLKYVRTTQGFLVFPCLAATHKQVGDACGWPKLSAGMVDWDADGRPLCMGESDSLGIKSREDDTEALRAEWGMVCRTCNGRGVIGGFENSAAPGFVTENCPDCNPAPITLTPAMRADAAAIGACCDPLSLEPAEPV